VNADGYWLVRVALGTPGASRSGWMQEHRAVMAQHLGRPLHDHETIHHLNGQRADNRVENLELWSRSQPPGQRVTDKTAWALAWLRDYAPELLVESAHATP